MTWAKCNVESDVTLFQWRRMIPYMLNIFKSFVLPAEVFGAVGYDIHSKALAPIHAVLRIHPCATCHMTRRLGWRRSAGGSWRKKKTTK